MSKVIFVYRVRGTVDVRGSIKDTMRVLNLQSSHRATLLYDTPQNLGFIGTAKDYLTWGIPSKKAIKLLLEKRGRVLGDKPLTDEYLKKNTKFKSIDEVVDALYEGEIRLKDVEGLKTYFRLSPPVKGFERKGIKKTFSIGGALGDRANKIDEFIERVV